jgi:hypothetical protein
VANKPYRVSDSIGATFVPAEILPSRERKHPIRLFARRSGAERYLYVGELDSPSILVKSLDAEIGAAHFKVSPSVPSRVLVELGALKLGDLDFTAVDTALEPLRQPTTVVRVARGGQICRDRRKGPAAGDTAVAMDGTSIFCWPRRLHVRGDG